MADELEHKVRPLLVVLGGICPSRIDAANRFVRKIMALRLGMSRERFRHETDFHELLDARDVKWGEYLIEDGPAVDGLLGCILRIDIRRCPLQRRRSVAGSQQIGYANMTRHRAEG